MDNRIICFNSLLRRKRFLRYVSIIAFIGTFLLGALLVGSFGIPFPIGNRYYPVTDWPHVPSDFLIGQVSGVDIDSHNNVFVFHRAERVWQSQNQELNPIVSPTVLVFDGETGELKNKWGEKTFVMPHSLTIDSDDNVWLTDVGQNKVFKFDSAGNLIFSLGLQDKQEKGNINFGLPTDIAVNQDGSFYVSDGYQNNRIIKFSDNAYPSFSWGRRGNEPGEFLIPHGLALDKQGRIYVADRGNSRLQIFDSDGSYITEWKGIHIGRPWSVRVDEQDNIYIVDGGDQRNFLPDRSRIVKLDKKGNLLASFGFYGKGSGQFIWPHAIAVKNGDSLYVGEVGKGMRIQKFIRKSKLQNQANPHF